MTQKPDLLLPEWLLELSREIRRQDDRATADPIFTVVHSPSRTSPEGPLRQPVAQSFLTKKGAQAFLVAHGHDYTHPSLFIRSLHNNAEMKRLRLWILSLTDEEPAPPDEPSYGFVEDLKALCERYCTRFLDHDEDATSSLDVVMAGFLVRTLHAFREAVMARDAHLRQRELAELWKKTEKR